jgi:hypothetical protein
MTSAPEGMKVFWFFFAKKNRQKELLFEKRSKNF